VKRPSDENDQGAELVVLLDPEPLRRELVAQAIRLHDPSVAVLEVASGLDAVAIAQRRAVALFIVAESGAAKLTKRSEELRRELPGGPIVGLLDGEAAGPVAGLDAVLGAPLDLDRILAVAGDLLEATESFVRGLGLEAVLQLLQQERKTCRVLLESRGVWGVVHLRAGRLIHAETRELSGTAALFEMLGWSCDAIRVRERASIPRASIHEDLTLLLLEHAVRRDHREGRGGSSHGDRLGAEEGEG
jgi:hypothetical protein